MNDKPTTAVQASNRVTSSRECYAMCSVKDFIGFSFQSKISASSSTSNGTPGAVALTAIRSNGENEKTPEFMNKNIHMLLSVEEFRTLMASMMVLNDWLVKKGI